MTAHDLAFLYVYAVGMFVTICLLVHIHEANGDELYVPGYVMLAAIWPLSVPILIAAGAMLRWGRKRK